MCAGPVQTLMLDEISTGLDSTTTFQIVQTLADFCHVRQATILLALLQPAPEVGSSMLNLLGHAPVSEGSRLVQRG
jgi:ABC-type cobalamin/Fe3+-siderophores transport system ATPase subunit